ncbi:HAD hydrolase-like protein [Arthrobacter sp. Sr24]
MTTVIPAMTAGKKRDSLPWVLLFDLDGTLVDPAGGITGGVEYALRSLGLPVPEASVLNTMIGPKLADALVNIAGVPEAQVDAVIAAYRAWYTEHGMAMSKVYPGVRELLEELKGSGVYLGVATQKPEPLAKKLLAHHGIDTLFHTICGSHADETLKPGDADYRPGKTEIIAAALAQTCAMAALVASPGAKLTAVMVGDRYQDVNGAASNGLGCIGVSWGFAAEGELAAAGATAVVNSTQELAAVLAGNSAGMGIETAAGEAGHGAV